MDSVLVREFLAGAGLGKCAEFCMECTISPERGVPEGFYLEHFQMGHGSGMWKEFCLWIGEWAPAWVTGR